MGDAGEEKERKMGGVISNLRARATGPNEQMDKIKGGEREGALEGLRMSPLMRIIYSSEVSRFETSTVTETTTSTPPITKGILALLADFFM